MTDRTTAATGSDPIDAPRVPQAAAWLGGLGLLPFAFSAALVAYGESSWSYDALRYYAAAILSFMGGVQWGLAMKDAESGSDSPLLWRRLSMSVAPALTAWLALLLSPPFDLMIIAAAFGLLLLSDLSAVRQGWAPTWYPRLRIPLTAVVIVALLLAALTTVG